MALAHRPCRRVGAATCRATIEEMPSAPTTNRAGRSREPLGPSTRTPDTRPVGSWRSAVTWVSCRTSTPASAAASTRIRSISRRRGAYSASTPALDRIEICTGSSSPSWKVVSRMGGVPAATTRSSRPQRVSWSTPARISPCVESESVPYLDRSTIATRAPALARSIAVDAPATRPPTTTAS